MSQGNVIAGLLLGLLIVSMATTAASQTTTQKEFDSLFVIASSGEVRFRDMVEPAIDSIAAMGEEVVPLLIDKFTTKSARERLTVINILKKIGSAAVPDLVQALRSLDGLVVQRVCWALGDIKDSAAVEPLIGVCDHSRWQVREQAIGALGKIGDHAADHVILQSFADSIGQVRKAAAVSAGKMGIVDAVPGLVHTLGDEFYGARLSAMDWLLKIDTAVVVQTLRDSIDSDNSLVGDLGCRVLGRFANLEAFNILTEQFRSFNRDRRAHAATAIIEADPMDTCAFRQFLFDREEDELVLLKMNSAVLTATHAE